MDAQTGRAVELGAAFESWRGIQAMNSDQTRLVDLIKEQILANAGDMMQFDSYRFDLPPLSMNGGFARARAVFGSETALESMLASLNAAVFGDASQAPGDDRPHPDSPEQP